MAEALEDVAPEASVRAVLDHVFLAALPALEANREHRARFASIIRATPALGERAAAKEARLVALLVDGLVARGVAPDAAELAAHAGWGVLGVATRRWRADPALDFAMLVDDGWRALDDVVGSGPGG